jgi:hypothetical protein
MTEDIYRHKNGLKHINIINSEGFSALFVVNTPVFDNSGVAHAVEHMVFRGSAAFPQPETLFQLTSLTDAKINASTFAETTYYHCQSQCSHTFILAINYLLNGLFNPIFNADDLACEIHDGNERGVIFRELLGVEEAEEKNATKFEQNDFSYGGLSASIGELSISDLTRFHQRFYHASNITLVTANADIKQIANLISLLPKPKNQSTQSKVVLDKHKINSQGNQENKQHQKKYSPEINQLVTLYNLWLQDTYHQEIDDYKEIANTSKPLVPNTETLPDFSSSNLISPLVALSNRLLASRQVKETINDKAICPASKKASLPNLFSKLFEKVEKHLTTDKADHPINQAYSCDQQNALWVVELGVNEKALATITSYIISAYPKFLAPRCQGLCYATQALTIESSAYLIIYSAFDVSSAIRMKETSLNLLELSHNNQFISSSLSLAKMKYCRLNQAQTNTINNITSSDISNYLLTIANGPHPKV